MSTITWTITAMDCYPQKEGNTNVVCTVHWTCAGTDGTCNASIYSTCPVPLPSDTFTPYANLTQSQVLGWIWVNGVDQVAIETEIEHQITSQNNPPIVKPALPWVA